MFQKFIASLFCYFLFINVPIAQTQKECGTPDKQSWFEVLKATQKTHNIRGGQLIVVPFQIHFFRASNGSADLTLSEIYNEIDSVNHFYANAGLVFVECVAPQIINDDYYYEFDYTLHDADVLNQFYSPNVVNMYFANTVTSSDGSSLCGYSRFPPSEDYVVMAANCATNGSTLAHELGHLFGLPHTHGGSSDELVDGSNCDTEGDYICDTPADPTLSSSIVNSNCIYTGNATDTNGMPYVPDPNNIMSYSRKNCRDYFSPIQYAVINTTYNDYRNYLVCNFPTDINILNNDYKVVLFPNPGQNFLQISLAASQSASQITLYNNSGCVIYNGQVNARMNTINTETWAKGIYFYQLINNKGEVVSGKWIKN